MKRKRKNLLKQEIETYYANKEELLKISKGQFVLIKDKKIIDTLHSRMDAISKGYKLFGNIPFLVKEIVEIEIPLTFTSPIIVL